MVFENVYLAILDCKHRPQAKYDKQGDHNLIGLGVKLFNTSKVRIIIDTTKFFLTFFKLLSNR